MDSSGRWDARRGDRAWPLEEGASGGRRDRTGRVSTAGPRGKEGTQSGRDSDVRNVETPPGSRRCLVGRPQGERNPAGGNRMPKKRTPVAERQQETQGGAPGPSAGRPGITGRIPAWWLARKRG